MGHLAAAALLASGPARVPQVGDTDELRRVVDQASERDGGSGSSHDADTIVSRVVAVRADGAELEYDLPASATAADRASTWQFPVRIFRPTVGPARLVDPAAVERRVDAWLSEAKLTRAACGRLVFTWNAFRIECDPQSVLTTVAAFDLGSAELREGADYRDENARSPAPLVSRNGGLEAELEVDPERVRRAAAETDVGVGEITGRAVTPEAARAAHARDTISGTISVHFDLDDAGAPIRRTRVVRTRVARADGRVDTTTTAEVLTRERLPEQ